MPKSLSTFALNGVNGSTGRPLTPALSLATMADLAQGQRWDLSHLADLRDHAEKLREDSMGLAFGLSRRSLAEAGWGVIFAPGVPPSHREALRPLLDRRRAQASEVDDRAYRELTYRPGETKARFLARHGVGPGPVDPLQLPYFLLIVGDPEQIPFSFQYQLDVQYGVGRLHFESADAYARYAESVVATEAGQGRRPRRADFFGVANPEDSATRRSLEHLVDPLVARLRDHPNRRSRSRRRDATPWRVDVARDAEATKARLAGLLGQGEAPALLFTASHGVGFTPGDPRFPEHQGALLCQDWPGPRGWRGELPRDFYFSAEDVCDSADVAGLVAFHFACYGAGTPKYDEYAHRESRRRQLAPAGFVARLPQRLLSHPRGGALAVVGHVERAWSYSFDWPGAPSQLSVFESALGGLLDGLPIGAAMEYFDQRYAELASDLSVELAALEFGGQRDVLTLSGMWTANNDARSYVVLGDPAVRLAPQP